MKKKEYKKPNIFNSDTAQMAVPAKIAFAVGAVAGAKVAKEVLGDFGYDLDKKLVVKKV